MIFVTGDTHGLADITKLSQLSELSHGDYVIVCGDLNAFMPSRELFTSTLSIYNDFKFTTLFVDGNHENFAELKKLPVIQWHGGYAQVLQNNVIHLMRGQIFNINNLRIFTMGGADSIDFGHRVPGYDWWPEELPNHSEYACAESNLMRALNPSKGKPEVDIIVTHTCPAKYKTDILNLCKNENTRQLSEATGLVNIADLHCMWESDSKALTHSFAIPSIPVNHESQAKVSPIEVFFDYVNDLVDFKQWIFGHFHSNARITPKHTLIYNEIVRIA